MTRTDTHDDGGGNRAGQTSGDPIADGGTARREIFASGGDAHALPDRSRRERLRETLDVYLFTPLRIGWSDWRTRVGGVGVLLYLLMGTVGVVVVPKPELNEGPRYLSPFTSSALPLGTDNLGRSIFEQVVHATPAMLKMAAAGVVFASGVAVVVGFVAGYKGGLVDTVLMTLTDVVITLPGLPLVIVIAAVYPPKDPFVVGTILAIDNWPGLARELRSQVLTLREESFVEAAHAMDVSTTSIVGRDLLPQLAPYVLVRSADAATKIITASVSLYFLGVLPFTTSNWGVMMNFAHTKGQAVSNFAFAGHWLLFPALALSGLTFSLVLFSQGLDRVFNPKLRAKHSEVAPDDDPEVVD